MRGDNVGNKHEINPKEYILIADKLGKIADCNGILTLNQHEISNIQAK